MLIEIYLAARLKAEAMAVAEEKQRAREQWKYDPAGAVYGREHEFGTREFFDAVERHLGKWLSVARSMPVSVE